MLRVHFLNVGHGDCTIIEHHSGRLTMIDINNSQEYDTESFGEVLAEEREKERAREMAGALTLLGGNPLSGLANPAPTNILAQLTHAMETVKKEITDPVAFMQKHHPGRGLWRFIVTHPDLDHMRGIKRLRETIGFANFWDTSNTKPRPDFQSDADKDDWNYYQLLRSGGGGVSKHNFTRNDRYYAFNMNEDGTPGGDNIEILSPTPSIVSHANADEHFNNAS